jgi:putative SOS response-associated peptidase YedK
MCGRYTIAHSTEEILERFDVLAELMATDGGPFAATSVQANYNVAPTNVVPIIRTRKTESDEQFRVLENVKWGLIPFWVKDLRANKPFINARAESLLEKPFFKKLFARHRCIIPADGFYEWMKEGKTKTPMRIGVAGQELFGLAGIWDDWRTPDGEVIRTCAIITTTNNELLRPVHNRMPVILPPDLEALWLNPDVEDPALLAQVLAPYPDELMQMYPVSSLVNSVANNSELLIKRLPVREPGENTETTEATETDKAKSSDRQPMQLKLL